MSELGRTTKEVLGLLWPVAAVGFCLVTGAGLGIVFTFWLASVVL